MCCSAYNIVYNLSFRGYRPDVLVSGTVSNSRANETGVTVNGIVATVMSLSNYEFFVNHVPLEEGENTITATAADTSASGGGYTASLLFNKQNIIVKIEVFPYLFKEEI